MASEREKALKDVIPEDGILPRVEATAESHLDTALSTAEATKQLENSYRHDLNRLHAELGWFGRVFGSESHAAIVIAFIVVILGFGSAIGLWVAAWRSGHPEYWTSEAHIALGVAASALSFVFGRGSKDSAK